MIFCPWFHQSGVRQGIATSALARPRFRPILSCRTIDRVTGSLNKRRNSLQGKKIRNGVPSAESLGLLGVVKAIQSLCDTTGQPYERITHINIGISKSPPLSESNSLSTIAVHGIDSRCATVRTECPFGQHRIIIERLHPAAA